MGDTEAQDRPGDPPKAPDPSTDAEVSLQDITMEGRQTNTVMVLKDEHWDLDTLSPLAAVKMLIDAVQALADMTGDILPTPPATRATTPRSPGMAALTPVSSADRVSMSPISPIASVPAGMPPLLPVPMPSPEAQREEVLATTDTDSGEAADVQQSVISRRFFLKTVPSFTVSDYLLRLHKYCPHSPGVYLAAAAYIHRLCVVETALPATSKTVHRLTLAAVRVASKALEDNKWSQDRIAKVGGVSRKELKNLEISLCYLLDFDLFVRAEELRLRMFLLQQAARHGSTVKRKLSDGFRMDIPTRQEVRIVTI